jgi:uncharacterized protein involved in exopolysaccharide biosynthesis
VPRDRWADPAANPAAAPTPDESSATATAAPGRRGGLLEILWRQKGLILATVFVAGIAGALYLLLATPTYRSKARLYVRTVGPNVMASDGAGGVQPAPVKSNLYTQVEVIRSTEILSLAAPGFRKLQTFRDADSVVEELKNRLVVDVGDKDELLTVAYDTPYREEAPKIVNGIVEAFRRYHTDEGESTAKKLQSILSAK